ncbi:MAG TPA: hypothetical protein DIU07_03335 [Rhodobacteraceae bacterium]|nr:hypothetical protein [Paracoccaceae bacterium]
MRHLLALFFFLAPALALVPAARGQEIVGAAFTEPTTRYAHGVLGDAVEWGALRLDLAGGEVRLIRLAETRVFEDLSPRIITSDRGQALAMVVESDLTLGARLALYGPDGLYAATPFIGQPNRWLAPVGAGDLDGDGQVEIAYVDRPHLAKTLRVWRLQGGALAEVASLPGVTNHRIGWDFIAGGLRDCGDGPEMVLASADWQRRVAVRFDGTALSMRDLGAPATPAALDAARTCD